LGGWCGARERAGGAQAHLVRDLAAMRALAGGGGGGEQVVDARPAPRFAGAAPEPRAGVRSGHMPGSRSLPASQARRARSGSPQRLCWGLCGPGIFLPAACMRLSRHSDGMHPICALLNPICALVCRASAPVASQLFRPAVGSTAFSVTCDIGWLVAGTGNPSGERAGGGGRAAAAAVGAARGVHGRGRGAGAAARVLLRLRRDRVDPGARAAPAGARDPGARPLGMPGVLRAVRPCPCVAFTAH
jgi:hypothetical protein